MKYESVPVTPYQQNCSIVWCEDSKLAAVIDPGGEIDRILARVDVLGLRLEKILLTHGHLDHVGGTAQLKAKLDLPIIGPHIDDKFWIDRLEQQVAMMGFAPVEDFEPDSWLVHGDVVTVGSVHFDVVHCPGHTPGHVVFFHDESKTAFVGDVLFNGSIGRTDFPRGNLDDLVHSIRSKLWPLGDEVEFIPGHGPNSTFGVERQSNPFVSDSRFG